jgi:hypothetical protein
MYFVGCHLRTDNNLSRELEAVCRPDFVVVPTSSWKVLFVLIFLAHVRRRIVHINVTEHPTAEWTAQQVVEAFSWGKAPRWPWRIPAGF